MVYMSWTELMCVYFTAYILIRDGFLQFEDYFYILFDVLSPEDMSSGLGKPIECYLGEFLRKISSLTKFKG